MVDYDDDEDDEEYKPPPRKQPEASEEEGELLRLKRKSPFAEREQEPSKKPRLGKSSKRENVFAVLCSTLSHAVLTGKKSPGTTGSAVRSTAAKEHEDSRSSEENNSSSSDDENHKDDGVSSSEHGTSVNGKLNGEESLVVAPKSSPEMAVNGS